MKSSVLRAVLVMAGALVILSVALSVHFSGFYLQSEGIFVGMFAICLIAADRTYAWVILKSRNKISAYAAAVSALIICALVWAEIVARLNVEPRMQLVRWMLGFGLVTSAAWLVLDLLLRGRLDRSNAWVRPTFAVMGVVALLTGCWAAYAVPFIHVRQVTAADCVLMAKALKEFSPDGLAGGMRLSSPAKCDWKAVGLPAPLGEPDFKDGQFHPWFSVEAPVYSVLKTRAVLSVGQEWVMLGGGGERCFYTRTFNGWRRDRCEESWIS